MKNLRKEPIFELSINESGDRLVCLTPCPLCGAELYVRELPCYLDLECHEPGCPFVRVLHRYRDLAPYKIV